MKKLLLLSIGLLAINLTAMNRPTINVNVTKLKSAQNIAQENFDTIMQEDWSTTNASPQSLINTSWRYWTPDQKKQVLLRLEEQEVISNSDLNFYLESLRRVPQI